MALPLYSAYYLQMISKPKNNVSTEYLYEFGA
jgi:hypothetical protein